MRSRIRLLGKNEKRGALMNVSGKALTPLTALVVLLSILMAGPVSGQPSDARSPYPDDQLAEWRVEIGRLLNWPEVSYVGFDEDQRMLVVAVIDVDKYAPKVTDELVRLGIPSQAVQIRESGRFVSDAPSSYQGFIVPGLAVLLMVGLAPWWFRRSLRKARQVAADGAPSARRI